MAKADHAPAPPAPAGGDESVVTSLLQLAHEPAAAARIMATKIRHRPFPLRASSPPAASAALLEGPGPDGRLARRRRRAGRERERRKAAKPKPIGARTRRRLGLHDTPMGKGRGSAVGWEVYRGLNRLWRGYVTELLGPDVYCPRSRGGGGGGGGGGGLTNDVRAGEAALAKLAAADLHGGDVRVVRSRCPGRVGVHGIVVRDRMGVLEIVVPPPEQQRRGGGDGDEKGAGKDGKGDGSKVVMVPKEGTVFRFEIPVEEGEQRSDHERQADGGAAGNDMEVDGEQGKGPDGEKKFVWEIVGDHFKFRAADRASKKWKLHFLKHL